MSKSRSIIVILFILTFMIISFLVFDDVITGLIKDIYAQFDTNNSQNRIFLALLLILVLLLDVLLPIPSSLVSVYAGVSFGFWGGAFVIGIGLISGSIFGYFLGLGLNKSLPKSWLSKQDIKKASILSVSLDSIALVLMRGIPVMAETSVIAAGLAKYSFIKFILLTGFANVGIAFVYAYAGSEIANEMSLALLIGASVVLPCLALLVKLCFDAVFVSKNSGLSAFFGKQNVKSTAPYSDLIKRTSIPGHMALEKTSAHFQVNYNYDVIFTRKAFQLDNRMLFDLIKNASELDHQKKILCVIDQGIIQRKPDFPFQIKTYFSQLSDSKQGLSAICQTMVLTGGEECKSQINIDQLIKKMLQLKLDRQSWVIAIGGGALLDCTGFACSIFHRGIRLVRMPSTVLGQNDAGIGVKNGINAHQHKNLLGAFTTPYAVVNDADLLTSLSHRDKRSGLAEAIKVALIKDTDFFNWLEMNVNKLRQFDEEISQQAIKRCVKCHIDHIARNGDPFERGNGRPLDYGHWSAHKLESLSNYQLRHGEAVAIGIVLDALYARELGWLSAGKTQRIINLIQHLGFATWHNTLELQNTEGLPDFFKGLEDFRQHLGGKLSIPMLTDIGQYCNVYMIDINIMLVALNKMKILSIQKEIA